MNNTVVPKHIQRLREREILLERRAGFHQERIKETAEYIKTDGVRFMGADFAESIEEKSPFVAKLVNMAVGNKPAKPAKPAKPKRKSILGNLFGRVRGGDGERNGFSISAVGDAVLPFIYALGEFKLLSYSLKGSVRLIRYGLRRLFGRNKRHRRRK